MRYPYPCLLAPLLLACSTTLSAEDYDQRCGQSNSECTVVFVGDICECRCTFAAINVAEKPRYDRDRDAIHCTVTKLCAPCPAAEAICTAGRCAVK